MAFTVWIEGVEQTNLTFLPDTGGNIRYSLTTRTIGSATVKLFAVDEGPSAYRPAIGDTLVLKLGGVDLFSSEILDLDETAFTDAATGWDVGVLLTLTLADQHRLLGYALYTKTYPIGTTLKAILQDLIASPLAPYGFTLDAGQATGPALTTELPVTDAPVDGLLNTLQSLTGWVWRSSPALVLKMVQPGTESSGLTLQDSDTDIIGGLSVRRSRLENAANSVLLRFSSVALSAYGFLGTSANFTNGETVTLGSITYLFQATLTNVAGHVKIGATANATLSHLIAAITGGAGSGTTYAAATTENSSAVAYLLNPTTMKARATTPGATGNTTTCTETAANASWFTEGTIPITTLVLGADQSLTNTTTAQDAAALAADGYPKWRAYADAAITDPALAVVTCAALLRRAIVAGAQIVSVTHQRGIAYPGQTVTLSFAEHLVSGLYMIVSVDVSDDVDGSAIYTFDCVAGSEMPDTWLDYFRSSSGGSSSGGSIGTVAMAWGGGGISGLGTAGTIPKWASSTSAVLTDSIISESGTTVTVAGTMAATTFSGSGASLTALPAAQLSGTIASATQDLITRTSTLVSGATGAGFTVALSTSTITGTLADARLSANVPLLNAANVFTLGQVIDPAAVGNAFLRFFVGGTQYGVVGLTGAIKGVATLNLGFYASAGQGMSWMVNGSATDAMTLSPAGLLTIAGTLGVTGLSTFTGGATVVSGQSLATGYSSGWAGSGYTLNVNSSFASQSYLEVDRLNVRGIMSVYELLVHQIRATNGSIFVANTGKAKTVTDNGGGSYTVETDGSHGFAVNDLIRAQRFTTAGGGAAVYQSDLTVSSVADTTHFTAALRSTYTAPAAGMEFVRLGNTTDADRQGSIYLTADDTNAPYINTLAGVAAFTDWGASAKIRSRIGNLNGSYGYTTTVYGAAFGELATAWITIDPTNGIRIGHGATTKISLSAAGDASFTGSVTASAGYIAGWMINTSSITYDTSVTATSSGMAPLDYPFYAGATYANRAVAVFRVTPAGALTATNATITGEITATSGAIGGWTISADSFRGGTGASTVGFIYDAGYTQAIWAGAADPNTAPFRVYKSGALVATNATITGAITATSGAIGGWIIGASQINDTAGTLIIKSGAVHTSFVMVSDGVTNNAGIISGNVSGDVVIFAGGAFSNRATAPFRVTLGGALVATSATITGAITATSGSFTGSITAASGSIGGFDIGSDYIRDAADSFGLASTVTGGVDVRFWAGATFANRATAPLRITEAGALVATSATITGAITATSGSFTGSITATGGSIVLGSTNRIWINDGGDGEINVGGSTKASAPFKVNNDGDVVLSGGVLVYNINVQTTANLAFLAGSGARTVMVDNNGYLYAV